MKICIWICFIFRLHPVKILVVYRLSIFLSHIFVATKIYFHSVSKFWPMEMDSKCTIRFNFKKGFQMFTVHSQYIPIYFLHFSFNMNKLTSATRKETESLSNIQSFTLTYFLKIKILLNIRKAFKFVFCCRIWWIVFSRFFLSRINFATNIFILLFMLKHSGTNWNR